MSYKVHYFDARGRAEIIRLLLTYADQPFEDLRYTGEQWQEFKPKTPFGQLPVLEIDGKLYGQTTAISNYLARKFGLYSSTDEGAFAIDRVENVVTDFRNSAIKAMMEKDETKKAEFMKKFTEEDSPRFLAILERLLSENASGYFVGSDVSLADFVVYDWLYGMQQRHPQILDKYTKLQALVEKIGAIPKIKTYVDARKPTQF